MQHRGVSAAAAAAAFPPRISLIARGLVAGTVVLLTLTGSAMAQSSPPARQTISVGPNINMVSGTTLPEGDPFLQRQNEPSIAVSTRNPCHLLAGANDYRTVDLPGLPGDTENGDAWLGLFKSVDCGKTWKSTLLPGYPQDQTPLGTASPLKGLAAGADPIVRAGTHGLFYYSGIVFDRSANAQSRIFVARFVDNNIEVDGNGQRIDPIQYAGASIVEQGSARLFEDKPAIAVDIPRNGAKTCSISRQSIPGGRVYIAYAAITQDRPEMSRLIVSSSDDCGVTWTKGDALSQGEKTNQGAALAVAPDGTVYVAWRRFAYKKQTATILIAKSTDGGKKFSKAVEVTPAMFPFDQGTTGSSFRTNAYPTMAIDGTGRVYLAWASRGYVADRPSQTTGDARIVVSTSSNGVTWSVPRAADNTARDAADPYGTAGHQFMPALSFSAGKLQLIYYDLRDDHTYLDYYARTDGRFTAEGTRVKAGDRIDHPDKVFWGQVMDVAPDGTQLQRRHSVDVRGAQADPGSVPAFSAWPVSQYAFGVTDTTIEQVQFNPPNLPLYSKGTAPFFGDYIDVAGLAFVPMADGGWAYNTEPNGVSVFHAVWTDNRDVRPPIEGQTWASYTPPNSSFTSVTCVPGTAGMRNANIYTAQIAPALMVGSPANAQGLHPTIPRSFPVVVANQTDTARSYRLSLVLAAQFARASFVEATFQSGTGGNLPAVTTLDVTVAPNSSVARSVFVIASKPDAQVTVDVREIDAPDGALVPDGSRSSLVLNSDITNPAVMNPAVMNPAVMNQTFNPAVMNPAVMNPAVMNPAVMNANLADSTVTDVTWTVKNLGTAAGTYAVKLLLTQGLPQGFATQLLIRKPNVTPAARLDCQLGQSSQDTVLANIMNPRVLDLSALGTGELTGSTVLDPAIENATFALAPGEEVQVTLRILDPNKYDNVIKTIDGQPVSVDPQFDPVVAAVPAVVVQAAAVVNGVVPPASTPLIVVLPPTLAFVQQPGIVNVGETFPTPVQVRALSGSGEPMAGQVVTLSLSLNPGGAILSGVTAMTGVDGIATFPSLSVSVVATGYQLRADSGAIAPARSVLFDVVTTNPPPPAMSQLVTRITSAASLTSLSTLMYEPWVPAMSPSGDYLVTPYSPSGLYLRQAGSPILISLLQGGTAVPGIPDTVVDTVSNTRMNASGAIQFDTRFTHGRTMKIAVIRKDGPTFHTVAFSDDIAPGTGGKTYGNNTTMASIGFNAAGDTAFRAGLVTAMLPAVLPQTTIFLAPATGPTVRLAGYGDPAPNTLGTFDEIATRGFSEGSEALFMAKLSSGGPGFGYGYGWFIASRTGVRKVVANNDPGGYMGYAWAITAPSSVTGATLNSRGQVAFLYGTSLWLAEPGAVPTLLLAASSSFFPSGAFVQTFGAPALDDVGNVVLTVRYSVTGQPYWKILRFPYGSSTPEVLVSSGDTVPGRSATFTTSATPTVELNNRGIICFQATVAIGNPNSYGLFRRDAGGTISTIVLDGDAALGGTVSPQSGFYYRLQSDSSVYYEAYLAGSAPAFATFVDRGSGAVMLTTSADSLPPGVPVFIRNLWPPSAGDYTGFGGWNSGGSPSLYVGRASTGTTTRIVGEGDTVSGIGTLTKLNANWVEPDASGNVYFTATRNAEGGSTLFRWAGGTIQRLVGTGDSSVIGLSSTVTSVSLPASTPHVSDAGQAVVKASYRDAFLSVRPALLVAGPGTAASKVVAYDDAAPGGGHFRYVTSTSGGLSAPVVRINHGGQVAFVGGQLNAGVTTDGIYLATPADPPPGYTIVRLVAIGDPAPDGGTFTAICRNSGGVLDLSDAGEALFTATTTTGGGIFLAKAGGPMTALVANGTPAPAGGRYAMTANDMNVVRNASGDIFFRSPLAGGTSDSGLFLLRSGAAAAAVVALQGQAAPGTAGVFPFINESLNNFPAENLAIGADGAVAFSNWVQLPDALGFGLFRYRSDGTLELLALRGDPMPDGRAGLVVGFSQGPRAGTDGRFFFRLAAIINGVFEDAMYMTALPGDPVAYAAPAPLPAPPAETLAAGVFRLLRSHVGQPAAPAVVPETPKSVPESRPQAALR